MSESTARRILERYRSRSRGPFPTADIAKVIPRDTEVRSLFHGRLDIYLGDIAGYASSAHRLERRGPDGLEQARRFLSAGFFDRYPEYGSFRVRINLQDTPDLFREMEAAELNRLDLLAEVDRIISSGGGS